MKKDTRQLISFIEDYLAIIVNNFKSGGKKITYNELFEMIGELNNMFNEVALDDVKRVGESNS